MNLNINELKKVYKKVKFTIGPLEPVSPFIPFTPCIPLSPFSPLSPLAIMLKLCLNVSMLTIVAGLPGSPVSP